MTLGYPESGHQDPGVAVPSGRQGQSGASASPTETPQLRDTVADPHRNPTDETAHSGILVMRVKRYAEQPVSSVDARELGCWSLYRVSALRVTDLLKSGSSAVSLFIVRFHGSEGRKAPKDRASLG